MIVKYALIATLAGLMLAAPSGRAAAPERALHVATDKAEVLNLSDAPAVVLVANPRIADVVVEQGHLIFVIGKLPGQTRLFVYGAGGKAILERDVVVVPPRDREVTIIRVTTATNYSCDPQCVALGPEPQAAVGPTTGLGPVPSAPAVAPPPPAPAAPAASGAVALK